MKISSFSSFEDCLTCVCPIINLKKGRGSGGEVRDCSKDRTCCSVQINSQSQIQYHKIKHREFFTAREILCPRVYLIKRALELDTTEITYHPKQSIKSQTCQDKTQAIFKGPTVRPKVNLAKERMDTTK